MKHSAAKTINHYHEFLLFLGAPADDLDIILPDDQETATLLGATILDQPWFKVEEIGRGGIFFITDALRDMRNSQSQEHDSARQWAFACAIIEAMPEADDPTSIYGRLLFNMKAIVDETEVVIPEGLKMGYHVWPITDAGDQQQAATA